MRYNYRYNKSQISTIFRDMSLLDNYIEEIVNRRAERLKKKMKSTVVVNVDKSGLSELVEKFNDFLAN